MSKDTGEEILGSPGGAEPSACGAGLREITRTGEMAKYPWPEDVMIQGGKKGIVFNRDGSDYLTAFVEAFPPDTFLRGEGASVAEAEEKCWAKYQRYVNCDGGGEHGPYEPRQYENGAGFCVKCGGWFSGVCEPSRKVQVERVACGRVKARWGEDVVLLRKWSGLVADECARLTAALDGEPEPVASTEDPTLDELERAARPLDIEAMGEVLRKLADKASRGASTKESP